MAKNTFTGLLERYTFEKYVLDVSIATIKHGGTTSKPATYEFLAPIDAWGIPKYPDKTVTLSAEADLAAGITTFISANEDTLNEPDCWLGTWIDPYTHQCHLDVTTIYFCLEDATKVAAALNEPQPQITALYNFKHSQTIYLWGEAVCNLPLLKPKQHQQEPSCVE